MIRIRESIKSSMYESLLKDVRGNSRALHQKEFEGKTPDGLEVVIAVSLDNPSDKYNEGPGVVVDIEERHIQEYFSFKSDRDALKAGEELAKAVIDGTIERALRMYN